MWFIWVSSGHHRCLFSLALSFKSGQISKSPFFLSAGYRDLGCFWFLVKVAAALFFRSFNPEASKILVAPLNAKFIFILVREQQELKKKKKKNREASQIMKLYIFFDAIDLDLLRCFPNLAGIRVTWRTCKPHSQRVWGWAWGFAFLTTSVLSLDESMFFAYRVALYYFIIVLFVRFESLLTIISYWKL